MLDDRRLNSESSPALSQAQIEGAGAVGAELQAARSRLGWALPDIAAALRIRLPYLEALEQGRVSDLPGTAYAIGFLRTYASALGLDAEQVIRRFKAEASGVGRKTQLTFPAPVPRRGIPAGAAVLLGLVLAVGAYVGWYRLSGEGKLPAEVVPAVPERLAPLADQAIRTAPPAPPAQMAPTPPPAAPAVPSPAAPSPQMATAEPSRQPLPSVPPSSAAAMAVPQPPAEPSPPNGDSRIVLRAKADSWMQVKEKGGPVLLNRVLKAGETWPVPNGGSYLLTTGNAGGTELVVDGVTAPSIGNPGAVRRDLPLDPDIIKDGKLPAQMQVSATSSAPGVKPASSPQ